MSPRHRCQCCPAARSLPQHTHRRGRRLICAEVCTTFVRQAIAPPHSGRYGRQRNDVRKSNTHPLSLLPVHLHQPNAAGCDQEWAVLRAVSAGLGVVRLKQHQQHAAPSRCLPLHVPLPAHPGRHGTGSVASSASWRSRWPRRGSFPSSALDFPGRSRRVC